MTTRSKLYIFRAEQNTLNAVLRNAGGRYTATDSAAAQTFRRRCYTFINEWTRAAGSPNPYEQIEIALPTKGKAGDNVITFRLRAATPPGKLETLDGDTIPIIDEVGAMQPTTAQQIPEDQTVLDIDLDDITNSLFDETKTSED